MKQFILACCLLALAASLQVPQDKLQPVNDTTKGISSKFGNSSSHEPSTADHKGSITAKAFSTFGSTSVHGTDKAPSSDPDSGSGSGSGSKSKDSTSSVGKEEAKFHINPNEHTLTTLSYEDEPYTTDIFDWDDV